ncbi:ATP-binding protein [Pseudomonas indica]|uniref:histidine kinase n=1 Tax=Pseudomonas indica TaxID=137658 RepID=A0A1G9A6P2_9PSED|nr:ATP-binding protein [Pseudomonas indica]SDK23032.1 His Kinase A (phospho-acceptor) domain-containing protein [Pseudomonas indica]
MSTLSEVEPQEHTILIVDDTPANVGVLADYLEDQGFRVVVAQDGEEGLKRAEFVRPDLVLLDVMMPGIDGFETCRRLKAAEQTREIPVIFMTALTDTGSVVTGFGVGGVDYVTKPLQVEEVLVRVTTHLSLRNLHKQLTAQNLRLQQEVEDRQRAEEALRKVGEEQQSLIRKLQEAHDQLLQSEKMASIGQLAAGIAHEINNPVGFVSSNMGALQDYIQTLLDLIDRYDDVVAQVPEGQGVLHDLARMKQDADIEFLKSDIVALMAESKEGLKRVKDIVQALKDFSHVGESDWLEADLHHGLDSTLNIANNEIKYKARVVKEYGDLPKVTCLASQLNQVFMNLLVNAAHAIEGEGIITIRTGASDGWVWVSIRDNGAGISPENMNRIFEPFFTTKPIGSGTGLGLSLSYSIVKKHGGRIEVESEPGKGTCFTVHLPVHPETES